MAKTEDHLEYRPSSWSHGGEIGNRDGESYRGPYSSGPLFPSPAEVDQVCSGIKSRVCVVDDDPGALDDLAGLLESSGWDVIKVNQIIGASNLIRRFKPDLLLISGEIKSIQGRDLIKILRKNIKDFPPLVIYAKDDDGSIENMALEVGADDLVIEDDTYMPLLSRVRFYLNLISMA
jgi:CheY-like chemotaxis protein